MKDVLSVELNRSQTKFLLGDTTPSEKSAKRRPHCYISSRFFILSHILHGFFSALSST